MAAETSFFTKMDPKIRAKWEESFKAMSTVNPDHLLHDFRPLFVIYKDGRVHRFLDTNPIPAGTDTLTGIDSKDVVVSPETGVFVRLYKPPNLTDGDKLPLLVYFHGGAFCIEKASSVGYHSYLNSLSSQARALIASVDYRLAPEHPLPTAFEDCWSAVEWIARGGGNGGERWLKDHVDYGRVFFGGDSAGANIAHNMAKRVGEKSIPEVNINGVVLVHPFFWGEDRVGSEDEKLKKLGGSWFSTTELWKFICPNTSGSDDPLINPAKDSDIFRLGCERVLVLVAELDVLRDRGFVYKDALVGSGWKGVVEVVEAVGENHIFHLMNPGSDTTRELMTQVAGFLNKP